MKNNIKKDNSLLIVIIVFLAVVLGIVGGMYIEKLIEDKPVVDDKNNTNDKDDNKPVTIPNDKDLEFLNKTYGCDGSNLAFYPEPKSDNKILNYDKLNEKISLISLVYEIAPVEKVEFDNYEQVIEDNMTSNKWVTSKIIKKRI